MKKEKKRNDSFAMHECEWMNNIHVSTINRNADDFK